MKHQMILRAIHRMPWCILPERLAEIQFVLENVESLDKPEVSAASSEDFQVDGDVAVIPIRGTIAPRMNMLSALSGGASAEVLRRQVRKAASSDDIKAILLDIDSPGGSAYGIMELGNAIFEARQRKPVVAMANPLAASAAYWIGSQASEFVMADPMGEVGSIGVIMLHQDFSGMFEAEGVKNTLLRTSKFKGEGNPYEPLSDEDREEFGRVMGLIDTEFHRAVARGRGLSVSTVRSDFGQGRMKIAREAMSARMVDRVESPERTMERLQTPRLRSRIRSNAQMTEREFEMGLREHFGFSVREAKGLVSASASILAGRVRDERVDDVRDEHIEAASDVRDEHASVRDEREALMRLHQRLSEV